MLYEQGVALFSELAAAGSQLLQHLGVRFPATVEFIEKQLEEMEMGGVMLAGLGFVPLSAFFATLWHQMRYRYTTKVLYDRAPSETIITDPHAVPGKRD